MHIEKNERHQNTKLYGTNTIPAMTNKDKALKKLEAQKNLLKLIKLNPGEYEEQTEHL